MTLDDLKIHPAFVTLGAQQKAFVTAYCTNGADKISAAREAYPTVKDDASALSTANRNLRHPKVKRLVADFYGETDLTGSKDEFLALLWRKVQGTNDEIQFKWASLYAKVKGYDDPPPAPPETDSPEDLSEISKLVQGV